MQAIIDEADNRAPRRGPVDTLHVTGGEDHHVPHDLADAAFRVGVIADVADAMRRQRIPENRQKSFAHRLGNPGQHAMRDHVVKPLKGWCIGVEEVDTVELYIRKAERPDFGLAA